MFIMVYILIYLSLFIISGYGIYFLINFAFFWKFLFLENGNYVIFKEKFKITFGCTAMFIPGIILGVIQSYIPDKFLKLFVQSINNVNKRLTMNKVIRFKNIIAIGLCIGIFTGFEFKLSLQE